MNDIGAVILLGWLSLCALLWLLVWLCALADRIGVNDA